MAHIHELIDFVVSAYIVNNDNVLLVHHKKLETWLPVGGHIELDEDSDTALIREIEEETGIEKKDLIFINNRPTVTTETKFLLTPQYVDIHKFNDVHSHLCLNFFIKSKTSRIRLSEEHNSIRWFSPGEMDKTEMPENVRFLAKEAIKTLNSM